MLDLQNESELLGAQMQNKEAMVRVRICEQVIQQEKDQEFDELDLRNKREMHEDYCGSCIFTLSKNLATSRVHGSRYPARKTI